MTTYYNRESQSYYSRQVLEDLLYTTRPAAYMCNGGELGVEILQKKCYFVFAVLGDLLKKIYKKTLSKVVPNEMTEWEHRDYCERVERGEYGPTSRELTAIALQRCRVLRSRGKSAKNNIHQATICITDSRVYDGNMPYVPTRVRSRKDIWENFPVCVIPLGTDSTGAERHSITWHNRNLTAWREDDTSRQDGGHGPNSPEEYEDYKGIQEYYLLESLKRCKYWTVVDAEAEDQICIIRMKFRAAAEPTTGTAPTDPLLPRLMRLNDIKAHYPVVWSWPANDKKRCALEFHRVGLKSKGLDAEVVRPTLLRALKASTAWRVLPSTESSHICILELA